MSTNKKVVEIIDLPLEGNLGNDRDTGAKTDTKTDQAILDARAAMESAKPALYIRSMKAASEKLNDYHRATVIFAGWFSGKNAKKEFTVDIKDRFEMTFSAKNIKMNNELFSRALKIFTSYIRKKITRVSKPGQKINPFSGTMSRVVLTPAAMQFVTYKNGEEFGLDIKKDYPMLNSGISLRQMIMYLIYIARYRSISVPEYDNDAILEELKNAKSVEKNKEIMQIFSKSSFAPTQGLANMLNHKSTYRIEDGVQVINDDDEYNVNMYVNDKAENGFDGGDIKTTDVLTLYNAVIYKNDIPPTEKTEKARYNQLLSEIPESLDADEPTNNQLLEEYNAIKEARDRAKRKSIDSGLIEIKKAAKKYETKLKKNEENVKKDKK